MKLCKGIHDGAPRWDEDGTRRFISVAVAMIRWLVNSVATAVAADEDVKFTILGDDVDRLADLPGSHSIRHSAIHHV